MTPQFQRLRNCTTGEILAEHVRHVTAPWQRTLGYLLRRAVASSEGLWFARCSSVHTVGMRAAIDVIFVDRERQVVRVVARAPRNRIFHGGPRAAAVFELGAESARERRVAPGDRLRLE